MRLFLSSQDLGNYPQRLISLLGEGSKKAAFVLNAQDYKSKKERREKLEEKLDYLKSLGLNAEEIDLRNYFGKSLKLEQKLKEYGLVVMGGGNVFILIKAMKASGFDKIIKRLLASDSIVYAGWSAGSAVMTPSLRGLELVDFQYGEPKEYTKIPMIWDGLGLIEYSIAPHYKSLEHPETLLIDKVVSYFKENKMPHKTLKDGQVIIVNGDKMEFLK